jgi:ERCC4-type nuclease
MIFVSPEQGSADLEAPLLKIGLPVEVVKLSYADVEWTGRGIKGAPVQIGVEVKRLGELTSDYDRFAGEQLPKMTDNYDVRYLLYEGEWKQDRKGDLLKVGLGGRVRRHHGQSSAHALRKKLLTLEHCAGMHRIQTKDQADTVRWLEALYRFWTDDDLDEHKSHLVIYHPVSVIPLSDEARAMAAWPGVGHKRARAVERAFRGSIRLASSAAVEDWAAIVTVDEKGAQRRIGEATARKIVAFLRGEGHVQR